jgi:hypothetical protein
MEDQKAPEQSPPLPSPSQPDGQKPCRYCRRDIHIDAKVCYHCRYHQSRFVQYFVSYGVLAALLAIIISVLQLNEARNERIDASEAKRDARIAVKQVQAAEQHVLEVEERQILRTWINILPDLSELIHPVTGARAQRRYTTGEQDKSKVPFQEKPGKLWEWTWTCDDDSLRKFTGLIEGLPFVPYARVARADCLKKRGDPSWKADAERAKALLEKMRSLEPHPKEIDDFYATCLSLLQPPE